MSILSVLAILGSQSLIDSTTERHDVPQSESLGTQSVDRSHRGKRLNVLISLDTGLGLATSIRPHYVCISPCFTFIFLISDGAIGLDVSC